MSTMSICNSKDSSHGPNANKVARRFMDFVGTAFEYYSKTEPSKDANEAFCKIATYLNSLTEELRVHCKKSQANSKDAEKPKEEKSKEKKELKSDEQSKELVLSAQPLKSATAGDNDCRICLDPVGERHFGMLEQCDHKYCEPCMRTLVRETPNQSIKCPTCRIKSNKVIFRSRFVPSGAEKMTEFDSMQCCATHRPEFDEDQQDTEDGEEGVMIVDDSESEGEQMFQPQVIVIDSDDDSNDTKFLPDIDNAEEEYSEESVSSSYSTPTIEFEWDEDDMDNMSSMIINWSDMTFSTSTESSTEVDTETETDTESDSNTSTDTDTELIMDWSESAGWSNDNDSSDSDFDPLI